MPIVRTYACPECNHFLKVTLDSSQWDAPPPECPECARRQMQQQFVPPRINGSHAARARQIAENIAGEDYHVGDMNVQNRDGHAVAGVRYKDQTNPAQASTWGVASEALQTAIANGRQVRQQYGSGLDVLQRSLQSGDQPDLIEASKRRAIKVW
jgi:hypothetical protein